VEVLPLDETLLEVANPMTPGGRAKAGARHDYQVKAALAGGPVAFAILGGAHHLSDSVRRLGGGAVEYARVTTAAYLKAASWKNYNSPARGCIGSGRERECGLLFPRSHSVGT